MKIAALRAFTQASYRNMKSYFTSLLNIIKTNKRIRIFNKNTFTILVASSSIFFIQLHVVCLTFEILFTTVLHFFNTDLRHTSHHYSLFFKSVVKVLLQYELVMAYLLSRENEHELCSFCRFSGIIIRGSNRSEKDRHLCR